MRQQVLALSALMFLCVPQPATLQTQEVCTGTKNALSSTGTPAQHYNNLKERYTGCEIVMGNLELTQMENNLDLSFLSNIREVTGYILIAMNQFSRLPLNRLRVIRGSSLYEKEWALSVIHNFEGNYGLESLGLTNLTEILEGGVQIIWNKNLSYAPSVNWTDIVRDNTAKIEIQNNGNKGLCDFTCKYCWGPNKDQCQKLTKTVCAPQCHGHCFGTNPNECCHRECAGGCTGPRDTDCFACRHVNHSGACVPHCPWPLVYNRQTFQLEPNSEAMYQFGSICVPKCPAHFVVDGSACVSSCPPGKTEKDKNGIKQCEACIGLCPKVCEGTGASNRQTVDSKNIDSFINCTKIQGSLHFLILGIKGDSYHNITALEPEQLKVFSTVQEITGILNIQSWPDELNDLSVFSSLTTIQGRSLHNTKRPFSLLVMKIHSLTSLGLRSLREISDGSVYISNNVNLCYHHTVDWSQIFTGSRQRRRLYNNDIKQNKPPEQCEAEGHMCDPLCSDSGCWGPGPEQCLSCRNHSRDGTCVAHCNLYSGEPREFAAANGECLACHPECLPQNKNQTCQGKGADQCVACLHLKDGPHCVSSCPSGVNGEKGQTIFKYPNAAGQCELCHLNCTGGCTGPTLQDCDDPDRQVNNFNVAGIVVGVFAGIFVLLVLFVLGMLYHRGLAIRRKRALRRYLESGEVIEPLDPGEKGTRVHARILKAQELRKGKLLGYGVFGTVNKGFWIPEGDSVKIPVAIKTIQDRSGRQTFAEITDHMLAIGSLDHPYIVRLLGICPGTSLQLVSQLSPQGSLQQHLRQHKDSLDPQRLLNWCVQIAKGMYYLEEHCIVHRNLAARNVLLKSDYIVQVSDFGVADLLYPDDKKYVYSEHKTPIKWMALESILFRRYTHQSDVWSYGVTVWEMMSYGAEPYAAMHPHDVPGLLEKGERLAQPQISTIDVYMVMVKCWMIDENVRPTFKELANEFTRMARDPPRYLVVKPSQNGNGAVESHQRDGPHLETRLQHDDDDDEVLEDGFATPPLHLSPARSHSRLRMASYKGTSDHITPVGYLPMTPGPGGDTRQKSQRRRIGSARTESECSEGRGTITDIEMAEFTSQTGSLRRGRSRMDSAYMSTSVSLASDPFSPGLEGVDHNGYVLPTDTHIRDRGSRSAVHPARMSRGSKTALTIPKTDTTQEYELMNKQPHRLSPSPTDTTDSSPLLNKQSTPAEPENTCSDSILPQTRDSDPTQTEPSDDGDSLPSASCGDSPCSEGTQCDRLPSQSSDLDEDLPEDRQPQETVVEYEYMDIRTETVPQHQAANSKEKTSNSDAMVSGAREAVYQNISELPRWSGRQRDSKDSDSTTGPGEYVDMDASGRPCSDGDQPEYQNILVTGRPVMGEDSQKTSLRSCVNAYNGIDEQGTSFDNPDYWHSRLFHKQDAVCT
nr:receptor tyrosine-protein kinase erbB-3b isoform X1 [Misgurnus anguillicaudatus]